MRKPKPETPKPKPGMKAILPQGGNHTTGRSKAQKPGKRSGQHKEPEEQKPHCGNVHNRLWNHG